MTGFFQWLLDNVAGGLLVATVAAVAGYLFRLVLTRRSQPENSLKYFPPPEDEEHNEAFYDHLQNKIRKAMKSIHVTGDGFSCSTARSKALARNYIDTLRQAMRNGVKVVRIQTTEECSEEWIRLLGDLIDQEPDSFSQYLLTDRRHPDIVSVCVIDPNSQKTCSVEITISTPSTPESETVALAGPAIFIDGNKKLSQDMRAHIIRMMDPSVSVRIKSSAEARQLLKVKR